MNEQGADDMYPAPLVEAPHGEQTILLIDDDPFMLRLVREYLADFGFRLLTAQSGSDGCAQAMSTVPDLVLLDLSMPEVDGFEVCEWLKGDPKTADIPIIFFTCADAPEEKKRGFRLGAVDYITKPAEQGELIARITVHLNQRRIQLNLQRRLANYGARFGPLDAPEESGAQTELPEHRLNSVNRATEILSSQLVNPPSLENLASAVNSNAKRISRDFQILYGMTAFGWLKEYRLQRAAERLRRGNSSIAQIADELGFSSSAKMATLFKERFQMTPRQYRASLHD